MRRVKEWLWEKNNYTKKQIHDYENKWIDMRVNKWLWEKNKNSTVKIGPGEYKVARRVRE